MTLSDRENLPEHIAIIMDGNGRWAQKHALGRIAGHRKGSEAVRRVVRACRKLGVKYLTLYAFSSENWSRPEEEVNALMSLLIRYLRSEEKELLDNGIRLTAIGNIAALPDRVKKTLQKTMDRTAGNREMTLVLALNYGGRDEILEAARKALAERDRGRLVPGDLTPELFSSYLYTAGIPDPDLLIRTSGEYRVSNFLLWQTAYTEFFFTDVLWPDFSEEDLTEAISDYQRRERRFGLTSEQLQRKKHD
ncbi:MAG TPA: isoprenyl transferase [Syntrophales bacterium]|jgi:undecaprenyl diphosphate synthase|nr:isoprenyl transferase [Syntrophales bacterium]HRT61445.1 isoprenyl transferase [Syntrophales bacterium]